MVKRKAAATAISGADAERKRHISWRRLSAETKQNVEKKSTAVLKAVAVCAIITKTAVAVRKAVATANCGVTAKRGKIFHDGPRSGDGPQSCRDHNPRSDSKMGRMFHESLQSSSVLRKYFHAAVDMRSTK